jgi:hypothetical protein
MVKVAYSDGRELWSGLHERVVRDVGRGTTKGRFTLEDPEIGAVLVTGAILSALRELVDGRLAPSSIPEVATRILMLLGVPSVEATRIATRPLPVLGVLPDDADGHETGRARAHGSRVR